MRQIYMDKEHQMKKISILFIILGVGLIFCPRNSVSAADDLMAAAGIYRLNEKPKAPDFTLEDLEGNPVKLEDFKDKTVLLFFWATW